MSPECASFSSESEHSLLASLRARAKICRALAVLVIATAFTITFGTPAHAGTFTSPTFSAQNANAYINAQNTSYGFGFTTAASANLSRIKMTMPSGTTGYGTKYLQLSGDEYNYATTPDTPANSITGDLDIRVKAAAANWKPKDTYNVMFSKFDFASDQNAFRIYLDKWDNVGFDWSTNCTSAGIRTVTKTLPNFSNWSTHWLRVTLQVNNAGTSHVEFYSSEDGNTWNSLGWWSDTSASVCDSPGPLVVGSNNTSNNATNPFSGNIYHAELRNGINGAVVNSFDGNDASSTQAIAGSWPSSSSNHETWTLTRTGTNLPADVATELAVNSVSGLPSGGRANYRFGDNVANYYLPTPISVASATNCAVSLQGFTNTGTAGAYSSTITSYNDSSPPTSVDSATTNTVTFSDPGSSTNFAVTVTPFLVFNVTGAPVACNGETDFVSTAGTSSAVALGHMTLSSNASGGQSLSVTSNASGGYVVYIRGTQSSQNLRSSFRNWNDVPGTYASPASLPVSGNEAFGYTYRDSSTGSSVTNPGSAQFIALDNVNRAISGSTTSSNGTACVSFDAQSSTTTAAGYYSATVIYTVVPSF